MGQKEWLCNGCAKKLQLGTAPREDVFWGRKEWGYFSEKDLEIHEFILCEKCYDKMIHNFAIPVARFQKIEVLQEQANEIRGKS